MVLGAAGPKGTTRNVPSRTAVLLRIRLSGCNTGPQQSGKQKLASVMLGLEADSPELVQEASVPDALSTQRSCLVHTGRMSSNLRAHVPSGRTEGEAERAFFSLLGRILEVVQITSLPVLEGELGHTSSLAAAEVGTL